MGAVMPYNKPALSISDQAERLKQRGLQFEDSARVQHYLTYIGYYRISAYWLPFEQPAAKGQPRNHQFQPDTTFEQVLSLYVFDRQLRLLVMEAIERIETAVRTRWAHELAVRYGPHAHVDASLFKSPWQHASDIARMAGHLEKSNETFIAHYRSNYSEPYLPPIWAVVETLTLGGLSRWFEATKSTDVKSKVAKTLGMPTIEVLEHVLHALTTVRNVCAHHGRLWNRRFTLQLPHIKRLKNQMVIEQITTVKKQNNPCSQCGVLVEKSQTNVQQQPSRQVYNYLLVMTHLMNHINPGSSWRKRLGEHIHSASAHQQKAMGFPVGWERFSIWQGKKS